jgi:Arc/MetJ family transcription regulator
LKRIRRIEIVRYTRRVMQTEGEADADLTADCSAAIRILSRSQGEQSSALSQVGEQEERAPRSKDPLPRLRRFWISWLRRE